MRLVQIAKQTTESVLSIAGIRSGTEEPHYLATRLTDRVEIRQYGPRIAAETVVDAEEEEARRIGFRRLAGYIFGGNHRDESIAMTAPVSKQSGDKIAMTAPVAQSGGAGRSTIRFFMPSKWSMATLPEPNDDNVKLVEVPAETFAVLRFSGNRGREAVDDRTTDLLNALHDKGLEPAGEPVSWFYDPPWTLPFRRRNEIAVPVGQRPWK